MTIKTIISLNSKQEPFIPDVLSTPLSKKLIFCWCTFLIAVCACAEAADTSSASAAGEVSSGTQRDELLGSEGAGIKLTCKFVALTLKH